MEAAARYPDAPGYVDTDTSRAAADAIAPHVSRLAQEILEALRIRGPMTCWEIEQRGYTHQTASARLRELALKKRIVDSGERRWTGSKRIAIVWEAI